MAPLKPPPIQVKAETWKAPIALLIVGFFAGLLVAMTVHWWMTERSQQANGQRRSVPSESSSRALGNASGESHRKTEVQSSPFRRLVASRWYVTKHAQKEREKFVSHYEIAWNIEDAIDDRIKEKDVPFLGDDGSPVLCFTLHYSYSRWVVRAYISDGGRMAWSTSEKSFAEHDEAIVWMIDSFVAEWKRVNGSARDAIMAAPLDDRQRLFRFTPNARSLP
jgi:hypothetical protein